MKNKKINNNINVTVNEAARLIMAGHLNPAIKPLSYLLVGSSGIGKTVVIETLAKITGAKSLNIRATEMEPPDMMGYFHLDKEKYVNSLFPKEEEECFILLDEINRASPSMQNACMRILEGRGTNSYKPNILKHTVIGAANFITEDDYAEMLGRAILNRPFVLKVIVDVKEWIEYMTTRKILDIDKVEKIDEKEIKKRVNEILEKIKLFIQTYPKYLNQESNVGQTMEFEGVPNPRNWEEASKIIVLYEVAKVDRNIASRIATKVGTSAAVEFENFYNDPEPPVSGMQIIENYLKYKDIFNKHQKEEIHKAVATISDFCTVLKTLDKGVIEKYFNNILNFIKSIDPNVEELRFAIMNDLSSDLFHKIITLDEGIKNNLLKAIKEVESKFKGG